MVGPTKSDRDLLIAELCKIERDEHLGRFWQGSEEGSRKVLFALLRAAVDPVPGRGRAGDFRKAGFWGAGVELEDC